jgi:uncharacterized protein with von Willebrand factor type A (vWA) domain
MRSMVMFGGVGMQPQVDALRRRVDILVATPGRLLDHVGQRDRAAAERRERRHHVALKPARVQARKLADDRGIRCLVLDYERLKGVDDSQGRLF